MKLILALILISTSLFAQQRQPPPKSEQGLYISLFGNSRYQLNPRNYFRHIGREEYRSQDINAGGTIGFQFLSGRHIEEMSVEVSHQRVEFFENPENFQGQATHDDQLRAVSKVTSVGLRINTAFIFFPITLKGGYATHEFDRMLSDNKHSHGPYFGIGIDIGVRSSFSLFWDLTSFEVEINGRKRYLSGYDMGIRFYF